MTRKLFLSYTTTVQALHAGDLNEEDLQTGLFYLGCTRDHVLNPDLLNDFDELEFLSFRCPEDEERLRTQIRNAVLVAEKRDGIVWRYRGRANCFHDLDNLLIENGYPSLHQRDDELYTHLRVKDCIAKAGLDLDVIA